MLINGYRGCFRLFERVLRGARGTSGRAGSRWCVPACSKVAGNSRYKLQGPRAAFNRAPVIPGADNYTGRDDHDDERDTTRGEGEGSEEGEGLRRGGGGAW